MEGDDKLAIIKQIPREGGFIKLKNKKTGQVGNFIINKDHFECVDLDYVPEYNSLAELNADWEDVSEEPKEDGLDNIIELVEAYSDNDSKRYPKEIVRKLKAFMRLKEKGFRFNGYDVARNGNGDICGQVFYKAGNYWIGDVEEDLDLLFCMEEMKDERMD